MPGRSSASIRSRALAARTAWRSRLVTSRPERRQDRRLVARARAELEDAVAGLRREQLGHPGDDPRLADRLAGVDRDGLVGVRATLLIAVDEALARDLGHGREHALVTDARWRAAGPRPCAADPSSAPMRQRVAPAGRAGIGRQDALGRRGGAGREATRWRPMRRSATAEPLGDADAPGSPTRCARARAAGARVGDRRRRRQRSEDAAVSRAEAVSRISDEHRDGRRSRRSSTVLADVDGDLGR